MKRTEMPRSTKPLERRTELRSTKGLDRGKPPRSNPKPKAQRDAEAAVRAIVFERDGGCLLRHVDGDHCFGRRRTFHHLRKASQGGDYTVKNGVCLCVGHNEMVEDHPHRYRSMGLVVAGSITHHEAESLRRFAGIAPRPGRTR